MASGHCSWELLGIYYGLIAFFAGLLIPLHYGLAVDLVEDVTASRPSVDRGNHRNADEVRMITWYIWASDLVVYMTGLYGVAAILIGVFIISCNGATTDLNYGRGWTEAVASAYLIALTSICCTQCRGRATEARNLQHPRSFVRGFRFVAGALICLGVSWWCFITTYLWVYECDNSNTLFWADHVMAITLFVLGLMYLLWLALAAFYSPLTNLWRLKRGDHLP